MSSEIGVNPLQIYSFVSIISQVNPVLIENKVLVLKMTIVYSYLRLYALTRPSMSNSSTGH